MQTKAETTIKNENLTQGKIMEKQYTIEQAKLNINFFRQVNRDEDKAIKLLQKGANPFAFDGESIKQAIYDNKHKVVKYVIENYDGAKDFIQDKINKAESLGESETNFKVCFAVEPSRRKETLSYLIREIGININEQMKEKYEHPATNANQADIEFGNQILAWENNKTLNQKLTEKLLSDDAPSFSMEKPKQGLSKKMKSQGMKI